MNDEIKEILDELKYISNDIKVHIQDENIKAKEIPSSMVKELRLNSYSAKLLLDYLTNLQQIEQDHQKLNGELREENKRLNNIINELKQKNNLAENILYDYLYNDNKITKERYEQFKGMKEGKQC